MRALIKLAKEYFDFESIYSSRGYDEIIDELESEVKELTQKLKIERDVVSDLKAESTRLSSELLRVTEKHVAEINELEDIIKKRDLTIADQSVRLDKTVHILNCAESKAKAREEEFFKADIDRAVLRSLVAIISFGWAVTSITFYLSLNK